MKFTPELEIVDATGDLKGAMGKEVAPVILQMLMDAGALLDSSPRMEENLTKMSVIVRDCVYTATQSEGFIYVVKR